MLFADNLSAVQSTFTASIDLIRKKIGMDPLNIEIDETTDIMDKLQVNDLVDSLDGSPSHSMPVYVDYIDCGNSFEM